MSSKKEDDDRKGSDDELSGSPEVGSYLAESKSGDVTEDAVKGGQLSAQELIERVQEYFYGNDALAKTFEDFVNSRADCVDLESVEYKLAYTDAYEEYKNLFEMKIGGYIENELGSTVETFYEALESKIREDECSDASIFGQILVSVTDFDIFMTMMREGARSLQAKAAHK